MTITESAVEIPTPTGPMRSIVFRPADESQKNAGRKYPGLVFYSEIFQITGPIHRTGAYLAGHGYIVVVPEIYHELEPAGTVLAYDQAGADVGNANKPAKGRSRPSKRGSNRGMEPATQAPFCGRLLRSVGRP